MPEIVLNEKHEYFVDGQKFKGVTQILEEEGLISYWNQDPYYLERGRIVHKATHLIDQGVLDWNTVDPEIVGYLEAYERFKRETGIVFEHREIKLCDPVYQFCGTPDAVFPLTDIKVGEGHDIQLGAYYHLLNANGYRPGREAFQLKLNSNGTYRYNPTKEDIRYLSKVFLSARIVNQYKEAHNVRRNGNS